MQLRGHPGIPEGIPPMTIPLLFILPCIILILCFSLKCMPNSR